MKQLARISGAIVLGAVGTEALGRVCAAIEFKPLDSWTLAHGRFIVVWPVLALASYLLLGLIPIVKKKPNQSPEPTGPSGRGSS